VWGGHPPNLRLGRGRVMLLRVDGLGLFYLALGLLGLVFRKPVGRFFSWIIPGWSRRAAVLSAVTAGVCLVLMGLAFIFDKGSP